MVRLSEWGAGACLADDMGLGKTVQTIAFLLHKAAKGPSLVVCPASVMLNWANELNRFAPSLEVKILNESSDRDALLDNAKAYDVVLTTYGLLVREEEALTKLQWNIVCLDEAHTIKNRGTKMSSSAMKLKAESRVILTGTPIQNYLSELWNLFQFLNPGLLGTFDSFMNKYILPIERDGVEERRSQLKRMITPFMLRRTKAEVVEELPEKTEITHDIQLTDAEITAYETLREATEQALQSEDRRKSPPPWIWWRKSSSRKTACWFSASSPHFSIWPKPKSRRVSARTRFSIWTVPRPSASARRWWPTSSTAWCPCSSSA